ncbi:MAG: GNAT family N-acetyltransferase [Cellvibrionaceae bacterium]
MDSLNQLPVQKVSWQSHKKLLQKLRHKVFVVEQNVPEKDEWDNYDESAIHFACIKKSNLTHEEEAIATARLLLTGQIGRMAVAKKHRMMGLGGKLLQYIIASDEAKNIKLLFLHAQISAIPFYEKFGFVITDDKEFEDAGIMHKTMEYHYV